MDKIDATHGTLSGLINRNDQSWPTPGPRARGSQCWAQGSQRRLHGGVKGELAITAKPTQTTRLHG